MFLPLLLLLLTSSQEIVSSSHPSTASLMAVEEIMNLLQSGENKDYIGENISQLEHALQCAQLAKNANADEEIIIASLLHDIGHSVTLNGALTMNGYGALHHEIIGANYVLEKNFSTKVGELIKGHVCAKRYLTYSDSKYYATLLDASKETLKMQGGPMTAQEAQEFKQDPLFEQKLIMRFWDEQAKQIGWVVTPLESYKELLLRTIY